IGGTIRPWREKKVANEAYIELVHNVEYKKAERVQDCPDVHEYKVSYATGVKTTYRVGSCKYRLCPMCNCSRAMKNGIESKRVVMKLEKKHYSVCGFVNLDYVQCATGREQ